MRVPQNAPLAPPAAVVFEHLVEVRLAVRVARDDAGVVQLGQVAALGLGDDVEGLAGLASLG